MDDKTVWSAIETASLAILSADGLQAMDDHRRFAARLGDRVPGAGLHIRIVGAAISESAALRSAVHPAERHAQTDQVSARLQEIHGFRADLAQAAAELMSKLLHGVDETEAEIAANDPPPIAPAKAVNQPAANLVTAATAPTASGTRAEALHMPPKASRVVNGVMLGLAAAASIGVLIVDYGMLMPFSEGNWVSAEDAINALIMGSIATAPVAFAASLGFTGAALVGALFQAAVFLIAAAVAGDGVQSLWLACAKGFAFALAPAAAAELTRIAFLRATRPWKALAVTGMVYGLCAGIGTYALILILGIVDFGLNGLSFNAFQIGGALFGGVIGGLGAALLHFALSSIAPQKA